jgi:hypothetical protein
VPGATPQKLSLERQRLAAGFTLRSRGLDVNGSERGTTAARELRHTREQHGPSPPVVTGYRRCVAAVPRTDGACKR